MSTPYVAFSSSAFLQAQEVTASGTVTTTSSTDALLTSMTLTPTAGNYLILFNSDFISNAAGAAITFSYYVGGVQVAVSQRKIIPLDGGTLSVGAARGIAQLQSLINVNGSQAIEVRWSISSGTATATNRSLISIRSS